MSSKQLFLSLCALLALGPAASAHDAAPLLEERAENASGTVIEGDDGWLFLTKELQSYARPSFWGPSAAEGSAASSNADPMPAIKGFHEMLAEAGIRLIVVPVPGKVAVYPDKVVETHPNATANSPHSLFVEQLQAEGVEVVDLYPLYQEMRADGGQPFARQDSHWSPEGLEVAVSEVAERLRGQDWFADASKGEASTEEQTIEALGDLVALGSLEGYEPESLTLLKVTPQEGLANDPDSPVVLIGDSHALVYSQPINGGISAQNAGLADRLFAQTGLGADVVANQGSGVNAPRARLARRGDNLTGKKAVIWVFASRDFTEEPRGWAPIPVIR